MPVVSFKEILDPAFEHRYGVAAFNVFNDLTLEAVLAAAAELDSPVIIQTSLKTVKSVGADVLYKMFRAMADDLPVPVTLHLDHCPDREWITTCLQHRLELGALRRLAPRRRREHAPDGRGREGGRARSAPRSRARSRRCAASRTTSAPRTGGDVHPVEVSGRFIERDGRLRVRAGGRAPRTGCTRRSPS